ncbi:MAG TPA: histidine phosphatase family protein [Solimonas sp.]|nr:histidine phosphatase family protein [Solimonas sp.]
MKHQPRRMPIFIVRHGETDHNAARQVQVPASPLSAAGRAQAQRLAQRLAGCGVTRILSSDLARAVQTAQCLGERLGLPVEQDATLRERDFGDLRGTPYATLTVDPFAVDYAPPNGETWTQFHARVELAWLRIAAAAQETSGALVVVTHGLVCRALAKRHLALPPGQAAPEHWSNTGLTEIEGAPPWTVRVLHCTAHLERGEARAGGAV